jgi:hypothetical protein
MSVIPFDDINYLNIFPFVGEAVNIEVDAILRQGGTLQTGAYTFLFRYLDEYNTPTSFFASSAQVAIPTTRIGIKQGTGSDGEQATSHSIRLRITNLDTQYDRFQVAVIPQYNGVAGTPVLLPPVVIINATMGLLYNGDNVGVESSLDEVLINTASYKKARTLTQVDGSLYMGNLERHEVIDYQKYANNIKVEAVTNLFESDAIYDPYENAEESLFFNVSGIDGPRSLTYASKGFKRGDVYAFYISFLLNDGTETQAYHIPGRAPTTFEYKGDEYEETALIPDTEATLKGISANDTARWYQLMSVPHATWNTGYWENQDETYPFSSDWEVWDVDANGDGVFLGQTLAGQKVRHHHMPDAEYEPVFTSPGINHDRAVLGVKFSDIKIPTEFVDRIKGIKIHFAKRSINNQLVIDQSTLVPAEYDVTDDVLTAPPSRALADTYNSVMVRPFNTLRLKQNIEAVNFIKVVGEAADFTRNNILTAGTDHEAFTDFYRGWNPSVPDDDRFRIVTAKTYIDSYGFNPDGLPNSIVRTSDAGFDFDFDNTNNSEFILLRLSNAGATVELGTSGEEIPAYLVDICQYKENLYLEFDSQELTFTGKTFTNIEDFYPPTASGGADDHSAEVFGGDTFIGFVTFRSSRWRDQADDVESTLQQFAVESYAYPRYRSPGTQPWEQWSPAIVDNDVHVAIIWKEGRPNISDKEGDIFPADPINYNADYLMNETYKPTTPFPKRRSVVIDLPTRIIRSRQDQITADIDLFRQFREDDFVDLPTHRGDIVKLANVNNLLIPHMERSLYRTRGKEELSTGDFRAFLGSGDIFEIKPEELYETDVGHAGLQFLYSSVVTEYGYFFADPQARKVFHLTTSGLREVSAEGMEDFFEEALQFNFEYLGFKPEDNASSYFGVEVAWDPIYKRYLLTKKDVKFAAAEQGSPSPSPSGSPSGELEFDEEAQLFIDPDDPEAFLDWDDERYFAPDVFTISYSPEVEAWVSFHDYVPEMYFFNTQALYSSFEGVLHKHNIESRRGRFYGSVYPSILEYVDNRNASVAKTVASLFINSEVFNQDEVSQRDKTVTTIRIRNSYQDTGDLPVSFFTSNGNARYANGFWRINQLRNLLDANGELVSEREWYEKEWLSDRYHYVKLEYDNVDNHVLHIISSELNVKQSLR